MSSSISTLRDLLTQPEFLTGLSIGTIGLIVAVAIARSRWAYAWGMVLSAAALIVAFATDQMAEGLAAGLLLLVVGGVLLRHSEQPASPTPIVVVAWGLIVLGSTLATQAGDTGVWARFALPLLVIFLGRELGRWETLPQAPLVGVLFAITAFGVWTTVPDTETARGLLGVAIPMSIATHRSVGARLSLAGAFAVVTVIAWVAATGGGARGASIAGAMGCIGFLAIIPALGELGRKVSSGWILTGHALFVLISARVIGLWVRPFPAVFALAALTGLTYLLLLQVSRRDTYESSDRQGPR